MILPEYPNRALMRVKIISFRDGARRQGMEPRQQRSKYSRSRTRIRPISAIGGTVPNPFTAHPRAAGETYWQHFGFAMKVAASAMVAGCAAALHAVFPFLMERTASRILLGLADRINAARQMQ
jgi:hypothetical protein